MQTQHRHVTTIPKHSKQRPQPEVSNAPPSRSPKQVSNIKGPETLEQATTSHSGCQINQRIQISTEDRSITTRPFRIQVLKNYVISQKSNLYSFEQKHDPELRSSITVVLILAVTEGELLKVSI